MNDLAGGQNEESGGTFAGPADGDELQGHKEESEGGRERPTGSIQVEKGEGKLIMMMMRHMIQSL